MKNAKTSCFVPSVIINELFGVLSQINAHKVIHLYNSIVSHS